MVVHVHCPACGCEFRRAENAVGTVLACPDCGKRLRVRTQRTTAEEEGDWYDLDSLVETKMSWFARLLLRKEIRALRRALQERGRRRAAEIIFGTGGMLDTQHQHAPDVEGQVLWVLADFGIFMARGALVQTIEYEILGACSWSGNELHLMVEDPEGSAKYGVTGMWLRPWGEIPPAQRKATQSLIQDLAQQRPSECRFGPLPEWAETMPQFLRPTPQQIDQLEAVREEHGFSQLMFHGRVMSSPAMTRRSMQWRCDLCRSRRAEMAEGDVLKAALLDRLVLSAAIQDAATFAEGLESWVPESVKRHFEIPEDEEVWGKMSPLTPDEVEQSMRYVRTLNDACELVIAVETLAKAADYNGAGHRVEAILGETKPDGQCQMHDRVAPPLPWIAELLEEWRLHDREAYARERAQDGALAWSMFSEFLEAEPDGDILLQALEGEAEFSDDFFSCAVEELFMIDNIDPVKWLANWRAIRAGVPGALRRERLSTESEVGIRPTPSAEEFFSIVTRPLLPESVLAAYPDVYHWFNEAEIREMREARQKGAWNGTSRLESEIFDDLAESELGEPEDEEARLRGQLKVTRRLVDYYRKHVNWLLECEP